MATSHMKVETHEQYILGFVIGRKGQDRPSSLHTK